MHIAVIDLTGRPRRCLALRVRRWLRQRRQSAVLCQVEPRLREDAGSPMGAAAATPAVARLPAMRGA